MNAKDAAIELIQNPKIALGTAAVTAGTAATTPGLIDWVKNAGVIAALILTTILIAVHIVSLMKNILEFKIIKREEAERLKHVKSD